MASKNVIELTDANFDAEVLQSNLPTLVDFWATWCAPCRAIAPVVEQLATDYSGKIKVGKLDIDQHQRYAQEYGVRSIPTVLVFKGGKVVGSMIGADPKVKAKLAEILDKAI